jgi:hypothetical protein
MNRYHHRVRTGALLVMMALLGFSDDAAGRKIAGITMPESFEAGDTALVLNGAGVRTKLAINIYAGGLYLKEKSADAAKIVAADEPMSIRLHIVSGLITPKDFEEATRDGFNRATGGNLAPIRERVEKFIAIFREGIAKHDVYDIAYVPGKGVSVYRNGAHKTTASGLDFKRALFGIWLGPKTANPKLRKGMLGG